MNPDPYIFRVDQPPRKFLGAMDRLEEQGSWKNDGVSHRDQDAVFRVSHRQIRFRAASCSKSGTMSQFRSVGSRCAA